MTENVSSSEQLRQSRFQFSLASLFTLTFLVACVLSVCRCLGPLYGWASAIPLGIVTLLLLCTRFRCTIGTMIGAVILAVLGYFLIIGYAKSDPHFIKAMVLLGSYGGAAGASIHAIILKRWVIGGILLAVAILVLAAILWLPIRVP